MSLHALIQELDNAVGDGTAERRAEILERLTDVFVAGSAGYSDHQIEFFDDVFVRIAAMIEVSARAELASRLAIVPRAPSGISRALASDDDIDVAGPVLAQSQRLDDETLVAAARTKSQQHLLAISRRASLDEPVTDILVERGDKPVMLSTASNPSARFSDAGYTTLVSRSAGDDELTTCVALRPDIPRQHLLRLLVRASHAVQLKLEAAHPAMAETIQQAVADAATEILDKSGTLSRIMPRLARISNRCNPPGTSAKACDRVCDDQQIRGDDDGACRSLRPAGRGGRPGDGAAAGDASSTCRIRRASTASVSGFGMSSVPRSSRP